jgi:hypothetical protein
MEPKPAPRPRLSFLWWALGIPVAVALVMGVVTTLIPSPGGEVAMHSSGAEDAGTFAVQLFAKPKDGSPLRLAAEFPGSGEGRVRASDGLQVKFLPNPRGGRVYAVDVKGTPTSIGTEGHVELAAGTYEVWALHDLSMMEAQALEDAKAPWPAGALPVRISDRADVALGKLQVEP